MYDVHPVPLFLAIVVLYPALFCAVASVFLRLYLKHAVHIKFSPDLFSRCAVARFCSARLLMLPLFSLCVSEPIPLCSLY